MLYVVITLTFPVALRGRSYEVPPPQRWKCRLPQGLVLGRSVAYQLSHFTAATAGVCHCHRKAVPFPPPSLSATGPGTPLHPAKGHPAAGHRNAD